MSADHMGMVFAAEGLDGSEKLLLLGYTNWTDPYGYCWPSEERLVDDCGTSRSTVQRAKRKLVEKRLLKSVRRKNSKGEPISNLSRVNLPLLASMARAEKTYDDNLIDQITFDDDTQGDPEATLRGTPDNPEPPSDLLKHHSDSYPESNRLVPRVKMTHVGKSQNDSPSLKDPEGISLSGDGPVPGGEREAAVPEPAGADVVVDAYEAAAGRPLLNGTRATLRAQAVELLAAGRPVEWVAARAAEMPANGWTDLIKHCERSRVPLLPGQTAGPGYAPGRVSRAEIEAAKAAILARGSGL
ncbi:helix-turn-helix domain-containing protein [Streptomyces sp. NPDC059218]|uniref:helix-turn-helix domain-containing protein n=1 Tax=unclassified Streptomyces TaxID=2593676 RepID=UPI003692F4B8